MDCVPGECTGSEGVAPQAEARTGRRRQVGCRCLRRGLSVEDAPEAGILARSGHPGRREALGPWVGGGVRLRPSAQGAASCQMRRGARDGSNCEIATRSLVLGIWSPNLRC